MPADNVKYPAMILCDISGWLQAGAAILGLLLTLLTLLVLKVYADDTKRIADVSASQTENAQMPCLVVRKKENADFRPIGWAIENQGFGPALNIRLTGHDGGNAPVMKPTPPLAAGDSRLIKQDIEEVFTRWPRDFRMEYESLSGLKYSTTINMEGEMQTQFHRPAAGAKEVTIGDVIKSFKKFLKRP